MNLSNQTEFWIFLCLQILGFVIIGLRIFTKSYINEKGKNLATREDVGEITQIVESIKNSLSIKTEELKSELSYKSEHLIHLRASEREAIINYYKATWVLVLNFTRTDLTKYSVNNYETLLQIKDEIINLKYLRDLSESELMFFYDEADLVFVIGKLNLSLLEFERSLLKAIDLLSQLFLSYKLKIDITKDIKTLQKEIDQITTEIFANWYEERHANFNLIRLLNNELKNTLFKRLKSLTS